MTQGNYRYPTFVTNLRVLDDTEEDALTSVDGEFFFNSTRNAVRFGEGTLFSYASDPTLLFITVRTLKDLTDVFAPVSDEIRIPADYAVILQADVDLLGNSIVALGELTVLGAAVSNCSFTSSNTTATIQSNATGNLHLRFVNIINTAATPIAVLINDSTTVGIFITCFFTGDIDVFNFRSIDIQRCLVLNTLHFHTNEPTGNLVIGLTAFFQSSAIDSILFDNGVTINSLIIADLTQFSTFAGGTGITVENPDAIGLGTLDGVDFVGSGNATGVNPVAANTFAMAAGVGTADQCGFDGTNLVIVDNANDEFHLMSGISGTIGTTIAAPASNPSGAVFFNGDLWSIDSVTNTLYQHDGFSTTILDSNVIVTTPIGLTNDGRNMLVQAVGVLYTINPSDGATLDSFTLTGFTTITDLSFDGLNLWITDSGTDLLTIMQGISNTQQYSIVPPASDLQCVVYTEQSGVIISQTLNTIYEFDTPLTFDQSASTWLITNSTNGLLDSSDGICVDADVLAGQVITISTVDVWVDIADAGVNINYNALAGTEKFMLSNSVNGEVTYVGARSRAFPISANIAAQGVGGTDVIEIGISVNGNDPALAACTITQGIVSNTQRGSLTSPPTAVRLITNDTYKIQLRNRTDTSNVTLFQSKTSSTT